MKLKIFLFITQVANCGVGYYRQWLPLKKLEEQGKIELRVIDFNWGEKELKNPFVCTFNSDASEMLKAEPEQRLVDALVWADLIYICRDETTSFISVIGAFKEWCKERGVKRPILLDIDDLIAHTRPHNPGYLSFYPGSAYIQLNKHLAEIVDGITVSTEYLKKQYKKTNKKIFICPNSLDIKLRDKFLKTKPTIPKKKNEVRIGWAGSAAHWENLKGVESAITDIMKKYPNVTFHYTGLYGDLFKRFKNRVKTVKFAKLKDWPKKLASMGLDIAIAPLADNHFNRAKSNLRVLEYWACKYAVVASPVLPYKFIKDGVDGYLAREKDEWFDKLELLIKDKDMRNKLAQKGYERLVKEYDVEKNCGIWMDVFKKYKS